MFGFLLALFLGLSLLQPSAGHAALEGEIKPHEVAVLPEYCRYTITFTGIYGSPEGTKYWLQRLGPAFKALHHYCWAMIAINRANGVGATALEKRHNLSTAVSDIDFVLRYAKDDFPLMPEILTRRGEALVRLKDFARAEADFQKAIQIMPTYWPAYRSLAESYRTQSRRDAAIQVLRDGIAKASDPRMLQRMLNEMEKQDRQAVK